MLQGPADYYSSHTTVSDSSVSTSAVPVGELLTLMFLSLRCVMTTVLTLMSHLFCLTLILNYLNTIVGLSSV